MSHGTSALWRQNHATHMVLQERHCRGRPWLAMKTLLKTKNGVKARKVTKTKAKTRHKAKAMAAAKQPSEPPTKRARNTALQLLNQPKDNGGRAAM